MNYEEDYLERQAAVFLLLVGLALMASAVHLSGLMNGLLFLLFALSSLLVLVALAVFGFHATRAAWRNWK